MDRTTTRQRPVRIVDALIALRAIAMLLVVVVHSAMGYVDTRLSNTLWSLYDPQGHWAFDFLCYGINGVAMPLFFLLAGMSAAQGYRARGPREFLRQRWRRLLLPLLFGCLTILPATYVVWAYGMLVSGQCSLSEILRLKFRPEVQANVLGPVHLWFLEYLFIISIVYCGWRWLTSRLPEKWNEAARGLAANWIFTSRWKPLLLAVPTFGILCFDSDAFFRLNNSFLPDWPRLVHYGWIFFVGCGLAHVKDLRSQLLPYSRAYLLIAIPLWLGLCLVVKQHLERPLVLANEYWLLILFGATCTWFAVFGIVGMAIRHLNRRDRALRYVSEASFWMFFAHVPVVVLVQVLLWPFAWPPVVKFAIVLTAASAFGLLSYEWMVRYTWIGKLLTGTKKSPPEGSLQRYAVVRFAPGFALVLLAATVVWQVKPLWWNHNFHAVVPGKAYRSARLSPHELDDLIERRGLRTVVCVFGSITDKYVQEQTPVCQRRGVELYTLIWHPDRLPRAEQLARFVQILDQSPRPILIQGAWGTSRTSLASAMTLLLEGAPLEAAMRQFDLKYGQLGGPRHAALAKILAEYEQWRAANRPTASHAETFRRWVTHDYRKHARPSQRRWDFATRPESLTRVR